MSKGLIVFSCLLINCTAQAAPFSDYTIELSPSDFEAPITPAQKEGEPNPTPAPATEEAAAPAEVKCKPSVKVTVNYDPLLRILIEESSPDEICKGKFNPEVQELGFDSTRSQHKDPPAGVHKSKKESGITIRASNGNYKVVIQDNRQFSTDPYYRIDLEDPKYNHKVYWFKAGK